MKAAYFDNENFEGEPLEKIENGLFVKWNGESPAKGINPTDFSVM